jgi:hypothetical protein
MNRERRVGGTRQILFFLLHFFCGMLHRGSLSRSRITPPPPRIPRPPACPQPRTRPQALAPARALARSRPRASFAFGAAARATATGRRARAACWRRGRRGRRPWGPRRRRRTCWVGVGGREGGNVRESWGGGTDDGRGGGRRAKAAADGPAQLNCCASADRPRRMHSASRSASCASTSISRQSRPNSASAALMTWLANCGGCVLFSGSGGRRRGRGRRVF